jgi:hypothetical protein
LDNDCCNDNDQEKRIVKEMFKNVDFFWLQLSGIDFIENLEQNENVEENAVMFTSLIVPVLDLN